MNLRRVIFWTGFGVYFYGLGTILGSFDQLCIQGVLIAVGGAAIGALGIAYFYPRSGVSSG